MNQSNEEPGEDAADGKSDDDPIRPGVKWPVGVHKKAKQLAHEHRCDGGVSEFLMKLIEREWGEDAKLPAPTDFSPSLQNAIRKSQELHDELIKKNRKKN